MIPALANRSYSELLHIQAVLKSAPPIHGNAALIALYFHALAEIETRLLLLRLMNRTYP